MNEDFMLRLDKVKEEWYKQSTRVLKVSSGYRCRSHNRAVSKYAAPDGSGPHTIGKAIDILISGPDSVSLYKIARQYMTGIGLSRNFIHMDALTPEEGTRPTVWRYS